MKPSEKQDLVGIRKRMQAFAKRHYLNATLRNAAVFLIASASILLIASALELFFKNDSAFRALVFYALTIIYLGGFIYLVLIPALRGLGLLKGMSEEEISVDVGRRVKEVDDKLLNILMLEKMKNEGNTSMIQAAIHQKSTVIASLPFHLSASFSKGLNYMKYAGIFMLLLIITGLSFPDLYEYGTRRIMFYDREISPPPPFFFEVNRASNAIRNENYEIKVKVSGEVLPGNLFIQTDGKSYKSTKLSSNEFTYSMKNVTRDFTFLIEAEGVRSDEFVVEVLSRPAIAEFSMDVIYPEYLGLENQNFKNVGNLSLPEGTQVSWKVKVKDGIRARLNFEDNSIEKPVEEGMFLFDSVFTSSAAYSLGAIHENGLKSDSINYRLNVIRDEHPAIEIMGGRDSSTSNDVFIGKISDDYGLSKLRFGFKKNGGEMKFKELALPPSKKSWEFVYEINWAKWNMEAGEEVQYFFEVWDNDGVNGPKYARSRNMMFRVMDEEEIERKKEDLSNDIESSMEEAIEEARELKKDIADMQKDMVEEKKLDWSDKKRVEDLMKRNESLKKKLHEISEKHHEKNSLENDVKHNDEISRKMDELHKLMEEVLDDETLEKLRELQELMDKLQKEDIQKAMEDIEMSNEQLEQELDRSLELYKQLEFEIQLEKVSEELESLKEKQEELRNDTESGEENNLDEKQEDLKKEFEDWEKEMDKLGEMNQDLENKHELDEQRQKREETKEEMDKAGEQLKKGKNKKAGENQKGAEQKMGEMQDELNALQMAMQAQAAEDVQSLRNTLENLIEISFQQEDIMKEMKGMSSTDPKFNETTKEQRSILDGMKVIEDSLNALGKRVSQIEPIINKETALTKMEMEKAIKAMTERKTGDMLRHQQLAMTSINNLAVLLDEVVDQLQKQMAQSSGQCKNPGQNKPSSSSMQQMQKQLNDQISKMKKMMEKGKNPGQKPGQENKNGGGNSEDAESLAKMAAEQAKIREELRKLSENANQQDSKQYEKIGDLMEETERDIVNRQISQETILRQEKILTKLLEAEDAERQQDMEERRESVAGEDNQDGNLFDLNEYYNARYNNHEELIKENISFNRYFKGKVEDYLNNISK